MTTTESEAKAKSADEAARRLRAAVEDGQRTGAEAYGALTKRVADANQGITDEWVAAQQQLSAELAATGEVPELATAQQRYDEYMAAVLVAADGAESPTVQAAAHAYQASVVEASRAVNVAINEAHRRHAERLQALNRSTGAANTSIVDAVDEYQRTLVSSWEGLLDVQRDVRHEADDAAATPTARRSEPAVDADDSMLWPGAGTEAPGDNGQESGERQPDDQASDDQASDDQATGDQETGDGEASDDQASDGSESSDPGS